MNEYVGVFLILVAILGALALGFVLGYTMRGRHWR